MFKTFAISLTLLILISCKKNGTSAVNETPPGVSPCMQTQIDSSLAKPRGTLYIRIDAFKYQGNNVYLYYQGCCDKYNLLKDENCNYLFAPSGGFSGAGDGTHPNFFKEAKYLSNMWIDPR